MKALAILFNAVLFVFTGLVVATDGMPRDLAYVVFTLLLMLVPVANVLVIGRAAATRLQRTVGICNIVLLALIGLAIADQYPHPAEPGFNEYAVLVVLTPIVSAAVLLRGRARPVPASL